MKLFRKTEFHITEARNEDYPSLADIHARGFDHGWSEDDIAATLAGKGVNCLVANIQGKGATGPKGFMIMRTLAGQSEILTIAIDPDFRRNGMARALMDQAIRQLRSDKISQFFLEVSEYNQAALKLYNALNFKQISRRKSYYSHQPARSPGRDYSKANALVMQLELR